MAEIDKYFKMVKEIGGSDHGGQTKVCETGTQTPGKRRGGNDGGGLC